MTGDRQNYWFQCYGRMGNRPLEEVRRAANLRLIKDATGNDYSYPHYLDNEANRFLGYTSGERAVLLASINATTFAEIRFAWRVEMILAETERKLRKITEREAGNE